MQRVSHPLADSRAPSEQRPVEREVLSDEVSAMDSGGLHSTSSGLTSDAQAGPLIKFSRTVQTPHGVRLRSPHVPGNARRVGDEPSAISGPTVKSY